MFRDGEKTETILSSLQACFVILTHQGILVLKIFITIIYIIYKLA